MRIYDFSKQKIDIYYLIYCWQEEEKAAEEFKKRNNTNLKMQLLFLVRFIRTRKIAWF